MEKDLDITKPCYNREQILIFASPLALLYIEVPEHYESSRIFCLVVPVYVFLQYSQGICTKLSCVSFFSWLKIHQVINPLPPTYCRNSVLHAPVLAINTAFHPRRLQPSLEEG